MTQTGLNDEYLIVSWFGNFYKRINIFLLMNFILFLGNNDSWFEVYKLAKEQWKSEITTQEQVISFRVKIYFF